MPEEVKEKQLSSIVPMYENAPFEVMNEIVHIDASLVAMQLMLVARSYGYDTNAIGGYKKKVLPNHLALMKTVMCQSCSLPLGRPMKKVSNLFV